MKRISGSHYFLHLFINPTNCTISYFGVYIYVNESSPGASARTCNENLLFDLKRFEVWLVNIGHVKTKGVFADTATRKLTNIPAVIFSCPCWDRWFTETNYCIILNHNSQNRCS